jgi:hypothetical protein
MTQTSVAATAIAIGVAVAGCDRVFQLQPLGDPAADASGPTDAPVAPDAQSMLRIYAVSSGQDDAYQDTTMTHVAFSWISLREVGLWGALRFALADVPPGATIHEARLEVFVDSLDEDTPNVSIGTEASFASGAFTTAPGDISNRLRDPARVMWTASDIGSKFRFSPAVTELVRSRVSNPSWDSSRSITFIFEGLTGTHFEMRQYDYASSEAARLHLTLSLP